MSLMINSMINSIPLYTVKIIESGCLTSDAVMAKDSALLEQLHPDDSPLLHLYDWAYPCLTYGYFTDPAHHLHVEAVSACGLQMARRPTGGGIIFHLTDLAFSLLVPAHHPRFSLHTLDNYAWINQKVAEIIQQFTQNSLHPALLALESFSSKPSFCMVKPTPYDLIIEGKKVGGAAQRRTRHGLLHQGSLSLLFPPIDLLRQILKQPERVIEAMHEHSYCLLSEQSTFQDLQEARMKIKEILKEHLQLI